MPFLKAEWRKLTIANYEIDPEILKKYLPAHTELDFWDGKCLVSLVGFMFLNTAVLGAKIPFHINFEEVNLRFYVRRLDGKEWKRGVVFIKEIVPKYAITFVANTFYKEPYFTMPMKHNWQIENDRQIIDYQWKCRGKWQKISVETGIEKLPILEKSEAEFITEHYWGYTKINEKTTNEYEVTHPRWEQFEVKNFEIEVDFGLVYGEEFRFLNDLKPASVMLAEGSKITIESKTVLK